MREVGANRRRIRVLMQNRSTAFSHRGGDTVLMEKLKTGLGAWNVEVVFDTDMRENPADYDLVHLFNFALPELLQVQARRVLEAKKPFVVSTLCEDISSFHNQSIEYARFLFEYVKRGQDRTFYEQNFRNLNWNPAPHFANDWTANNAAALYTNGSAESETIRRDYGTAPNIKEIPLGHEIGAQGNPDLFLREYGVKDFVFCVGRLESRKNQLMLLKALEDIDIPVVFAGGGFSYQPDYDFAVRNFKRKGKTLILGKLSSEMMASAYMACRIHALPSWYELPGLVSLEAAHYGKNVVVTARGTTQDYLADMAFYCDPSDWRSVQNAVLAAYYSPLRENLSNWVQRFTWEETARQTYLSYCEVLGLSLTTELTSEMPSSTSLTSLGQYDLNSGQTEFQELLERGEVAAKNRDLRLAKDLLSKSLALDPTSIKALRSLGAVHLADENPNEAIGYFKKALSVEPQDPKSLSGLGMCSIMLKDYEVAYDAFLRSLAAKPNELVPILQLLECSYLLNRFNDLERILREYLLENPSDLEIKFCLAGCLYKLESWSDAEKCNNEVLKANPDHRGAKDLQKILEEHKLREMAKAPDHAVVERSETKSSQDLLAKLIEKKIEERGLKITQERREEKVEIAPISAPEKPMVPFSGIDAQLVEIEEMKRDNNPTDALRALDVLMKNPMLSGEQREKAVILRGDIEVALGHLETAKECFESVLKDNPKSPRALVGQGAIVAAGGDWVNAKALFEKALEVDPGFDIALAGLGLWAQFQSDLNLAWEYYQKALSRNPENSRALLGVIEMGYALNHLPEVETAVKNYLEMHPGNLDFVYALAGCYFAQNRISEAKAEVEKITLFEPHNERAKELMGMIQSHGRETSQKLEAI